MKQTKRIESIRSQAALLFAQKGYSAVGIAELCEATRLGRGALYHHIDSKEDLLYDISTRYLEKLIEEGRQIAASELDTIQRLRKLSRSMISVVYANLSEMTVCFREIHALAGARHTHVLQLHSDYQQIWSDTLAMGVAQGKFRTMPKVAIKGIMGMFFYSFMWLRPDGEQTAEEVADVFSDLIIEACIVRD